MKKHKLSEQVIEQMVNGVQAIADKYGYDDNWKDQKLIELLAHFE